MVIFADSQKSAKWTIRRAFQNCSFASSAAFVKFMEESLVTSSTRVLLSTSITREGQTVVQGLSLAWYKENMQEQ